MFRLIPAVFFFLFPSVLRAGFHGYPEVTVYLPEQHGYHAQTFGAYQDTSGVMFFANILGLIYFDGKNWSDVKNPHSESAYTVGKGFKSCTAYGGDGDFGTVERDQNGKFFLRSLSSSLPESQRNFKEVWAILNHSSGTLYCSRNAIFRWDGKNISVYTPTGSEGFHKFFMVNGRVIVREFGVGLVEWTPDGMKPLKEGDFFSDIKVDFIYPISEGWKIGTRDQGFYLFDFHGKEEVRAIHSEAGSLLKSAILYEGIRLHDGNFAYATHKRGVLICDSTDKVLEIYDSQITKANKTWYLYEDRQLNLWIANDRAICRADYEFPLRWFAKMQITANAVAVERSGKVWVASTDGLYSSCSGTALDSFSLHPGSKGHYYFVLPFHYGKNSILIASSNEGMQLLSGKSETYLPDEISFSEIRQGKRDTSLLVGIGGEGLAVYRYSEKLGFTRIFLDENPFGRLFSLTEDANGRFWITGEDGLVICLKLSKHSKDFIEKVTFRFPPESPFRSENFRCFMLENRLFFTGLKTLMEYKGRNRDGSLRLIRASGFSPELTRSSDFFRIHEATDGTVWISGGRTKRNFHGCLRKNKNNVYEIDGAPLSKMNTDQVNGIFYHHNRLVWIACNSGIVSYKSTEPIGFFPFHIALNLKAESGRTWLILPDDKPSSFVFPYEQNNLKFSFYALSYQSPSAISYSYFLDGLNPRWSLWDQANATSFNALFEGNYTFKVKAMDIFGNESGVSTISLKILPPWYRTWWAFLAYLLTGILGIRQIVRYNTARLKSLNEYLDRTVSRRTEELKVEKEKLLLANREITDSINYARIIQTSILPSQETIHKDLRDSFIFYLPRDIVSGDFYWFDELESTHPHTHIIVLGDCTGHGVPGAFMSMIGSEKLNQAFHDISSPNPSKILEYMNLSVSKSLMKGGVTESRDGMEMGICFFRPGHDTLSYSGANRPLWIFRKQTGEVDMFKPTKSGIAGGAPPSQTYELLDIPIQKGDRVYMFTDGAPDQFGGEKGRKLTTRGFREMLSGLQQYDMVSQKAQLHVFFRNWMSDEEQVDDILILGFEI